MSLRWSTPIATFFFIGLIPIAPGTFGSLASFPIYYLVMQYAGSFFLASQYLLVITALLTIVGFWAISDYQMITYTTDHPSVVIDEVIGMLIALAIAFKPAYELGGILVSKGYFARYSPVVHVFFIVLVVFRYFDISKPWIIGFVDRRFKNPLGVILDDVMAGVFAGLSIIAVHKLVAKYFLYQ